MVPTAQRSKVLKSEKITIFDGMEYDQFDGPKGVDIRVPTDDVYRTCSVCGGDCEPDTSLSTDGLGIRIVFFCPEHGAQSVVDPFGDLR